MQDLSSEKTGEKSSALAGRVEVVRAHAATQIVKSTTVQAKTKTVSRTLLIANLRCAALPVSSARFARLVRNKRAA
jgi:hypothetical protein